ncbi:MAG: 3-oxoacyl-ACP reductase, partial [Chloroflexota bacterium]|nr:3-oxoacyl-ACP reductase [Chloroflexota bacterium]
ASKHAVVSLSETLFLELAERTTRLKTSILCPEWVQTRIMESDRNRPSELSNASPYQSMSPETLAGIQKQFQEIQKGRPPAQVADITFDAIREERFYIFTHPTTKLGAYARMEDILKEGSPRDVLKL